MKIINFTKFIVNLDEVLLFKRKSFILYQKLDKELKKYNVISENIDEINKYFIEDIRIRRFLIKYIFYLENRYSAEIINFWFKNQEEIKNFIHEGKFIQINKQKQNENKKIIKFNTNLKDKNINYNNIDTLTFGEKRLMVEILIYFNKFGNFSQNINEHLFVTPKEIKKVINLRNEIAHHNFIFNHKDLFWFLKWVEQFIDDKHGWKEKFIEDVKNIYTYDILKLVKKASL